MARIQEQLSDHIVVLGFGISGSEAVAELIARGTDPHEIVVMDTSPEMRTATQMVTANSLNSRPRMPAMNRTGMNTAASDKVMETMVNPTSFDPFMSR